MSNLTDFTKDELITYIQSILNVLNDIDGIVGDVPVSEQLSIALSQMANKTHEHKSYVPIEEFNTLKKKVELLIDLVGDIPVSEQINNAINVN